MNQTNYFLNEALFGLCYKSIPKFNQTKREIVYRSTDPYCFFYNKWILGKSLNALKQINWQSKALIPAFRSWMGFAFENICHIHIQDIKKILRIFGVSTQTHYWSYISKNEKGAQIDLLLEHTNGSKNIDIIEGLVPKLVETKFPNQLNFI